MVGNYILRYIVLILIGLRPCYDFGRGKQWGGFLGLYLFVWWIRDLRLFKKGIICRSGIG